MILITHSLKIARKYLNLGRMSLVPSEIIAVLSTVGVIQGLLLSGYLLQLRSGNRKANIFLMLILLGISVRVLKSVLNYYLELDPWHRNSGLAGFLMIGPGLYFYGKALLGSAWSFRKCDLLHFVPSTIFLVFSGIIPNEPGDTGSAISYSLVLLQLVTYIFLSFLMWKRGDAAQRVGQWYGRIILGISTLCIFYIFIFLRLIPYYIAASIWYSMLIYSFTWLFFKVHHFNLEKYRLQSVGTGEMEEALQNLRALLAANRLYLKNDLSLDEVAERLDISSRLLSRVINEKLKLNFSELINQYRIEEAKRLLQDPDMKNEKIAGIAFDSGFNNLTSFNQSFKKNTNMTPSEYRKQLSGS